MNSNVSKRVSRSTNNGTSTLSPSTIATKRVKRIRRKPKRKSKPNYFIPVALFFLSLLLVVIFLSFSNRSSNTAGDDDGRKTNQNVGSKSNVDDKVGGSPRHLDPKSMWKKPLRRGFNTLDAENEPVTDEGFIQRLRDTRGKYKHSDWLPNVGDHSSHYTRLRQEYDALLPLDDVDRMRKVVQSLKHNTYKSIMADEMPYDIHDCPENPPPNYPYAWNVKDVLENWPTDDSFTVRHNIYQGLCVFNYETEKDKALNYREAELPFITQNDPAVMRTVERWNQPEYLQKMLGEKTRYRTEFSHNNHFMYWNRPGKKQRKKGLVPKDWQPPTEMKRMPFREWLDHANVTDEELLQPGKDHWYFRLIGCGEMGECDKDSSEYLFDELSFFQPRKDNELYMVEPKKQKGIHCRFGMKGVTAENHFDGSRNMIALLGGERRYLLSHPDQCENLVLYPRGHPSARHSEVDWADPDWEAFPQFSNAEVNEVVMQAGDVLYLPTNWFHHIISLDLNFQCNTRSGINHEYMDAIERCGF